MNAQVKEKLQKLFNSAYFISKVSTDSFFIIIIIIIIMHSINQRL